MLFAIHTAIVVFRESDIFAFFLQRDTRWGVVGILLRCVWILVALQRDAK